MNIYTPVRDSQGPQGLLRTTETIARQMGVVLLLVLFRKLCLRCRREAVGPITFMTSSDSTASHDEPVQGESVTVRHREAVDQFIEFWGTMASSWGINRTMAQVYALLYCADAPRTTDQIMERLEISRGSANMNLRALVDWALAEKTTVADSRKDHYVAEKDVWKVTARIIEERERQEVEPVREHLQSVADHLVPEGKELEDRPEAEQRLHGRLKRLIELIDVFERVTEALLPLVKRENEPLLRRLIDLARSLDRAGGGEESKPETSSP